jgi:geranylgeranyl diphosphate synthase type II
MPYFSGKIPMQDIAAYRDIFLRALDRAIGNREPESLYEPARYILSLGGKRMRPALTMLSAEIFGTSHRDALPAALAVEVFHNFSLVHDDIMDDAPLRRGKQTVHAKWDLNAGILSGDAMLILAYRHLESYPPETFFKLASLFSKTALEVCEGQQWDMDFEKRSDVMLDEYLKMIEYKTAVLVGAALQMGAIVAGASEENGAAIFDFGRELGIAFQIQDDYLDVFGDPEKTGKQPGGDIIENKKTFLLLKAYELADGPQRRELDGIYAGEFADGASKVAAAKSIFEKTGATKAATAAIRDYTAKALSRLDPIGIGEDKKNILRDFANQLMERQF